MAFLVKQAQPMQTVVTGQSGVQNGNVVYVPGTAVVGGVATPVVTTGTQTVSTVPAPQVRPVPVKLCRRMPQLSYIPSGITAYCKI